MNVLPFDKQVEIIAALTEGCSIRAVERMTGVHRDTIMRLGVRIGAGCARLHDRTMHSLNVNRIELDEVWSYVGKKRRQVKPTDGDEVGDQYIFTALASSSKAILTYRIGKRTMGTTMSFLTDLRDRVLGRPEISSDAFTPYERAVQQIFGTAGAFGQVIKKYVGEPSKEAARRYSPGVLVAVEYRAVTGAPKHISTSYIERSNLTLHMSSRRFTRLTNGFSKKLENHAAAVGLYVAHYNLCRVHETTRTAPAMALGVADHVWSISELIVASLGQEEPRPTGRQFGRFTVIDGVRYRARRQYLAPDK
jgi:IS1 family transposase